MNNRSTFFNTVLENSAKAFTLAEVLITLVVIGVVAAITVPMLLNDTNDSQWNVSRQKALATIGESFRLMTVNGEITKELSAKAFVEQVIPKYLKIVKSCDNSQDCGFSNNIKRPDGVSVTMPTKWSELTSAVVVDTMPTTSEETGTSANFEELHPLHDDSYFFQTLDGFSINFFYNPFCAANEKDKFRYFSKPRGYDIYVQYSMDIACFNAVYDSNGKKGPNRAGQDIGFITSFYNGYETKVVAVSPHKDNKAVSTLSTLIGNEYWKAAYEYCKNLDDDNWILPDVNEYSSIYLNSKLVQEGFNYGYQSRTPLSFMPEYVWRVAFYPAYAGDRAYKYKNSDGGSWVRCIRKNVLK